MITCRFLRAKCELPTFINSSVVEGREDVHEKSLDFEGFEANGGEKTREMRDDDWHGTGMAGSSVTHFMFPADNFALPREWPRWRMGHKLGGVANSLDREVDRAMGGGDGREGPSFSGFSTFYALAHT